MNPASLYGDLILNVIALAIIFVALVRVTTTPAHLWAHGRLSKTAWVVAVLWLTPGDHGVFLPIAAGVAIWHTRKLNRETPSEPPPLPFAEGNPDPADRAERDGRRERS